MLWNSDEFGGQWEHPTGNANLSSIGILEGRHQARVQVVQRHLWNSLTKVWYCVGTRRRGGKNCWDAAAYRMFNPRSHSRCSRATPLDPACFPRAWELERTADQTCRHVYRVRHQKRPMTWDLLRRLIYLASTGTWCLDWHSAVLLMLYGGGMKV